MAGGDYIVPVRAPGTLITELIYNGDHQNHVDGRAAEFTGGYGVSASQYQQVEDPYPGSVESLPPSLAGEITRLRFVLQQIISELSGGATNVNWYDQLFSPGVAFVGARVQRPTSISIPDSLPTIISFSGSTADFNSTIPAVVYDDMAQPTRFTVPIAGKYMAFCSVTWAANSVGRRQLNCGKNSFTSIGASISNIAATALAQPQSVTTIFDMQVNDFVQFSAFQTSGGAVNLVLEGARSIVGGLVFLGA